ncbi:chemotaxis protein CheA [Shewanella waksmanii]|uniref:chemotaxis protein CheA n=1 Tax=Shewanella waksmanii TaxID=213783 RepID=UPI003736D437
MDMEQLRQIFYQECKDNLQILEEMLVDTQLTDFQGEALDTIFRAAHSIKGGAATFNLPNISDFTHIVEAYLDRVRNNELCINRHSVDVLLQACDCIKEMLEGYELGNDVEPKLKQATITELNRLNDAGTESEAASGEQVDTAIKADESAQAESANSNGGWSIEFKPLPSLFYSGNDPLRIIRELTELDEQIHIDLQIDSLPELAEIDEELCYSAWKITVSSDIKIEDIKEVFEWVEDECDLTITQITCPNSDDSMDGKADATSVASIDSQPAATDTPSNTPSPSEQVKAAAKSTSKSDTAVSSIRVDIDKVDALINLVGELVITQSMLTEIGNNFSVDKLEKLQAGLNQLLQNSKDLQENVLNIRMLPVSFAFSRFPRLVRDLSNRLEKQVDLIVSGEHTELDKTVLERIVDPLVHLVRNGIDHGIETPEIRQAMGKHPTGTLNLNAYHQGGAIIIEIKDDGAGIDPQALFDKALDKGVLPPDTLYSEIPQQQVLNLIFEPGFSTAEQVSDISGRGVGMDVVKRNIEALGGHIQVVSTQGVGSQFTISLPLTLAILDGQLVRVADQTYVIPLLTIIESIQVDPSSVITAAGGVELYRLREENIPILRLKQEFELQQTSNTEHNIICFVEAAGQRVGLLLDELLDQQQVVIKSLESNYTKVKGASGATILGDGSVSLILDIQGILADFNNRQGDKISNNIAA